MLYEINIDNKVSSVEVGSGDTILTAILRCGMPLTYQCRSGDCGKCKCKLLSGEVDLMVYSPSALSTEERNDGVILTCRAIPKSNVWLKRLNNSDLG
ncbi:MAG: 2Fe-2S iron-sulfur cluster-binding protein [Burkholderiales bacterium]